MKAKIIKLFYIISVVLFLVGMNQRNLLSKPPQTQENLKLKIHVVNIKQSTGYIMLAMHNSNKSYLNEKIRPFKRIRIKAKAPEMFLEFENLSAGKYSITIFHDLNSNGKLDTYILGIPKEPYGFSQNPETKFSPPKFAVTLFSFNENHLIQIRMHN